MLPNVKCCVVSTKNDRESLELRRVECGSTPPSFVSTSSSFRAQTRRIQQHIFTSAPPPFHLLSLFLRSVSNSLFQMRCVVGHNLFVGALHLVVLRCGPPPPSGRTEQHTVANDNSCFSLFLGWCCFCEPTPLQLQTGFPEECARTSKNLGFGTVLITMPINGPANGRKYETHFFFFLLLARESGVSKPPNH